MRMGRPNEPLQTIYPVPAVNESWPWMIDQLTTVVARSFLDPSLHPFLLIYVLTVDVIYVTVCLCGLIWGLWFIYVIPPSDHLHPSMKGIWLPLRDGFLQPVCVWLSTQPACQLCSWQCPVVGQKSWTQTPTIRRRFFPHMDATVWKDLQVCFLPLRFQCHILWEQNHWRHARIMVGFKILARVLFSFFVLV